MTETVLTGTTITVQGQHTERHVAEQADVQLSVSFDGPKRSDVFDKANSAAETLRQKIERIFDQHDGPVTQWSSDGVSVGGTRPWNNEGKQLAIVYHAAIAFTARFSDFDVLAKFVEECACTEGVTISNIAWSLTPQNLTVATHEARISAVADAVAKARSYATALGLTSIVATAIADQGMLGDQSTAASSGGGYSLASVRSFTSADMGAPELSLKPEEIQVSAAVDARFVAN